jgi:hypothetical protein
MPTELLTEWLSIGTSGPTVDGREIKAQWLTDAAETYDPAEYTAVANAEHWFGNYGSVRQLRTIEDKKGRTVLQARIRPNKYYLQQNSEDSRLFFSMELTHNFAKTGKTYLTGLATTDKPASLGTSEAHFSRRDDAEAFRGGAEEIAASEFSVVPEPESRNIVAAVVDGIKEFFTNNTNKEEKEDYEMTEEQFNQMLAGQTKLTSAVESMIETVSKLSAGAENDGKEAEGNTAEPEKTNASTTAAAGAVIDEKGLQQLNDGFSKLNAAVEAMSGKLENALSGKFGQDTSGGTGPETDCEYV